MATDLPPSLMGETEVPVAKPKPRPIPVVPKTAIATKELPPSLYPDGPSLFDEAWSALTNPPEDKIVKQRQAATKDLPPSIAWESPLGIAPKRGELKGETAVGKAIVERTKKAATVSKALLKTAEAVEPTGKVSGYVGIVGGAAPFLKGKILPETAPTPEKEGKRELGSMIGGFGRLAGIQATTGMGFLPALATSRAVEEVSTGKPEVKRFVKGVVLEDVPTAIAFGAARLAGNKFAGNLNAQVATARALKFIEEKTGKTVSKDIAERVFNGLTRVAQSTVAGGTTAALTGGDLKEAAINAAFAAFQTPKQRTKWYKEPQAKLPEPAPATKPSKGGAIKSQTQLEEYRAPIKAAAEEAALQAKLEPTTPKGVIKPGLKPYEERSKLPKDTKLNGITIDEAAQRIVAGDETVLPHMKEGEQKLGAPTLAHAIGNQIMGKKGELYVAKEAAGEELTKEFRDQIDEKSRPVIQAVMGELQKHRLLYDELNKIMQEKGIYQVDLEERLGRKIDVNQTKDLEAAFEVLEKPTAKPAKIEKPAKEASQKPLAAAQNEVLKAAIEQMGKSGQDPETTLKSLQISAQTIPGEYYGKYFYTLEGGDLRLYDKRPTEPGAQLVGKIKAEKMLEKLSAPESKEMTVTKKGKVVPKGKKLSPMELYKQGMAEVMDGLTPRAKELVEEMVETINREIVDAAGTGVRFVNELGEWGGISSMRPEDLKNKNVSKVMSYRIARNRLENGYTASDGSKVPPSIEFLAETGKIDEAKALFENSEARAMQGLPTDAELAFSRQVLEMAEKGEIPADAPEVIEEKRRVAQYENIQKGLYLEETEPPAKGPGQPPEELPQETGREVTPSLIAPAEEGMYEARGKLIEVKPFVTMKEANAYAAKMQKKYFAMVVFKGKEGNAADVEVREKMPDREKYPGAATWAEKQINTPREAAKDLIRAYVERGDDLAWIKQGQLGSYNDKYHAQISGWAIPGEQRIKPDEIGVTELNGEEIKPAIFKLKDIFNEIKEEQRLSLKEAAGPEYEAEQKAVQEKADRAAALEEAQKRIEEKKPKAPLTEEENPLLEGTTGTQPSLFAVSEPFRESLTLEQSADVRAKIVKILALYDKKGSDMTVEDVLQSIERLTHGTMLEHKIMEYRMIEDSLKEKSGIAQTSYTKDIMKINDARILYHIRRYANRLERGQEPDFAISGPFREYFENIIGKPFWSKLQRVVLERVTDKSTPENVMATIRAGGVKQDEIAWSGIEDYLAGQSKVDKKELLDFLKQGEPEIKVIEKGEGTASNTIKTYDKLIEDAEKERDDFYLKAQEKYMERYKEIGKIVEKRNLSKKEEKEYNDLEYILSQPYARIISKDPEIKEEYKRLEDWVDELRARRAKISIEENANLPQYNRGDLVLPGGEDYKELLFTVPGNVKAKVVWKKTGVGIKEKEFNTYKEAKAYFDQLEDYFSKYIVPSTVPNAFKSHAWTEPNVLAWARINTRWLPAEVKEVQKTDPTTGKEYTAYEVEVRDGKTLSFPTKKAAEKEANRAWQGAMQKVLFVEEIQSDWNKQFREEGIADEKIAKEKQDKLKELNEKIKNIRVRAGDYLTEINARWPVDNLSDLAILREVAGGTRKLIPATNMKKAYREMTDKQKRDEANSLINEWLPAEREYNLARAERDRAIKGVPPAPFLKTWDRMVLKRLVDYAVKNGYDRIAWTTGQQQADRYNLEKYADAISYVEKEDGTFSLNVKPKGGDDYSYKKIADSVKPEELDKYVGKEIAKKITKAEGRMEYVGGIGRGSYPFKVLEGLDLKIGGEWAKNLYDQRIGNILKDLYKTPVETVELEGIGKEMVDYESLPPEVQKLVDSESPNKLNWGDKFRKLGYEVEFDMDGVPIKIRKLNAGSPQPSIDIRPIKEKIQAEGQPLWAVEPGARKQRGYFMTKEQAETSPTGTEAKWQATPTKVEGDLKDILEANKRIEKDELGMDQEVHQWTIPKVQKRVMPDYFAANISKLNDLPAFATTSLSTMHPWEAVKKMDKALMGGLADQYIYRPIEAGEKAALAESKAFKREFEKIKRETKVPEGSKRSAIAHRIAEDRATPEERAAAGPGIMRMVEWSRAKYDDFIDRLNEQRKLAGQDPIHKRKDYVTHFNELDLLTQLLRSMDIELYDIPANMLQISNFTKPNSPFFQFAQKRLGAPFKEDLVGAMARYAGPAIKQIHLTLPMRHVRDILEFRIRIPEGETGKRTSTSLFGMLYPNAYLYWTNWLNDIAGKRAPLDKTLFGKTTIPQIISYGRQLGFLGSLGGNVRSAIAQFWALPNAVAELGPYLAKGAIANLNPDFRKLAHDNSRILLGRKFENFPENKLKGGTEALTKLIEVFDYESAQISWLGAYFKGHDLGLRGKDLLGYADRIALIANASGATLDRPPINRGQLLPALGQFQTFLYQEYAQTKDIIRGIIKPAKDPKINNQITRALRESRLGNISRFVWLIAGLVMMDAIYKKLGLPSQMDDSDVLSLHNPVLNSIANRIPFVSSARFGGAPLVRLPMGALDVVFSKEKERGAKIKKAAKLAIRMVPGGSQAIKTYEGLDAVRRGYVKVGKFGARLKDADKARAILFGPRETEAYKNLSKRMFK